MANRFDLVLTRLHRVAQLNCVKPCLFAKREAKKAARKALKAAAAKKKETAQSPQMGVRCDRGDRNVRVF